MAMTFRNWIRLQTLKKAHASIIITGQWGKYHEKKSGTKIWIPETKLIVADSLLGNFACALYGSFNNLGGGNATADWPGIPAPLGDGVHAGAVYSINGVLNPITVSSLNDTAGVLSSGFVYSTDTTAISPSDSTLPGLIATGNGAGQLAYQDMQASQPPTINGNITSFILYRAVTNNSGATITVNKVFMTRGGASGSGFVIFEDLNTNAIPNLATTGARYQFSVTT